jgi:hypothetical protein
MIHKIIFQNEDKKYSFDLDETTTFYEIKKIIKNAAHLPKNSFSLINNKTDYSKEEYDNKTIYDTFTKEKEIYFNILINIKENENEKEETILKINLNHPCEKHIDKFTIYYCLTCKKSICIKCIDEEHKEHKIKEKADYLAPSKFLIKNLFSDSFKYFVDETYDKSSLIEKLKEKTKNNLFNQLKEMIEFINNELSDLINFFLSKVLYSKNNINKNVDLLQEYSIDAFIALKNDINTNKIVIDDEIFLTLDKKYNEISNSKDILKENYNKFIEINKNYDLIVDLIKTIYENIFDNLSSIFNLKDFSKIKNKIKESVVDEIEKEKIVESMFKNVTVQRKSLMKSRNASEIKSNNKIFGLNDSFLKNKSLYEMNKSEKNSQNKENGKNNNKLILTEKKNHENILSSIILENKNNLLESKRLSISQKKIVDEDDKNEKEINGLNN